MRADTDATAVPTGLGFRAWVGSIVLVRGKSLGISCRRTLSAIIGNRAVNNGTAIEAFPCIEDEEEIREPL